MTIRIKNTAEDYSKSLLHRTAPKFELEPMLGDKRIRLRSFIDITDEHYEKVKHIVAPWVKAGMVEVIQLGGSDTKAKLDNLAATTQEMGGYEELKAAEETKAIEEKVSAKLQFTEEAAVSETVAVTTESAGAPVVEEAPAPAAEEKTSNDSSKKGPGKKKLF